MTKQEQYVDNILEDVEWFRERNQFEDDELELPLEVQEAYVEYMEESDYEQE